MADNGPLSRPWQIVAKELVDETDPEKILALSLELTEALKWDVHSSRRSDSKSTGA
jgi:hypothetical protein